MSCTSSPPNEPCKWRQRSCSTSDTTCWRGRGARVPAHYRDVLPALAAAGVIPDELAQRLAGLAGLRNIIAHDYVQVDVAIMFRLVDERLDDLNAALVALSGLPELR